MNLRCVKCGRRLPEHIISGFVQCPCCSNRFYKWRGVLVKRLLFPENFSLSRLHSLFLTWLSRKVTHYSVKKMNIQKKETFYFPFWFMGIKDPEKDFFLVPARPVIDPALQSFIDDTRGVSLLVQEAQELAQKPVYVLSPDSLPEKVFLPAILPVRLVDALREKYPGKVAGVNNIYLIFWPVMRILYTVREKEYSVILDQTSGTLYANKTPSRFSIFFWTLPLFFLFFIFPVMVYAFISLSFPVVFYLASVPVIFLVFFSLFYFIFKRALL